MRAKPDEGLRWERVILFFIGVAIWFKLQGLMLPVTEGLMFFFASVASKGQVTSLGDMQDAGRVVSVALTQIMIWLITTLFTLSMIQAGAAFIHATIDRLFPREGE